MATSDNSQGRTPRSKVCFNFHAATPEERDRYCTALGLDTRPGQKETADDIRVENKARRDQVERQAGASGTPAQHARPGVYCDTGKRSIRGLKGVMLDEAMSDLLVRALIVTGALCIESPKIDRHTGRFSKNSGPKWTIRVWFTDPANADYGHDVELETKLAAFLKGSVCSIVHVWDDNPDGSANVEVIDVGCAMPDVVQKLRFGHHPRNLHDGLVFYHESCQLRTAEPEGTVIASPPRLTVSFGDILRARLGGKTGPT